MTLVKIESYKKVRGNLYEVVLDDGATYKLYDELILKYELLLNGQLDKKKLCEILEENSLFEAYFKALKYINIKMRTELEIEKYLKKYGFSNYAINYAITRLKSEGYLNEKMYAEAYINDAINLTSSGPKKIESGLEKLGISSEIAKSILEKINKNEWINRIERIIQKKAKTNKVGISLFKSKVYSELLALGYYGEDIKEVLNSFEVDTTAPFMKEADKVYNKLSNKYTGVELELHFKSKMYSKGFSSEMISEYLEHKN